jgi:cell division protein FtsB
MKILRRILPWIKNKYILTLILFIVWMAFFDRNDFLSQYSYRSELNKLEADKAYYTREIAAMKYSTHQLTSDSTNLEKFAREKYLMKKDNEDIFLIIRESEPKK